MDAQFQINLPLPQGLMLFIRPEEGGEFALVVWTSEGWISVVDEDGEPFRGPEEGIPMYDEGQQRAYRSLIEALYWADEGDLRVTVVTPCPTREEAAVGDLSPVEAVFRVGAWSLLVRLPDYPDHPVDLRKAWRDEGEVWVIEPVHNLRPRVVFEDPGGYILRRWSPGSFEGHSVRMKHHREGWHALGRSPAGSWALMPKIWSWSVDIHPPRVVIHTEILLTPALDDDNLKALLEVIGDWNRRRFQLSFLHKRGDDDEQT